MPTTGDDAPTFTATLGTSDHEPFDLDDYLGDGPTVLAFFPGAFTPPCTSEMVTLDDHRDSWDVARTDLFGISADSPFALGAFREAEDLGFDLVSDMSREAIEAYDVKIDLPELGLYEVANRAVYVVDDEGTVTYEWVADDPTNEPNYSDLVSAVEEA